MSVLLGVDATRISASGLYTVRRSTAVGWVNEKYTPVPTLRK